VGTRNTANKEKASRLKTIGQLLLSGKSPNEIAQSKAKTWHIPERKVLELVDIAQRAIVQDTARVRSFHLVTTLKRRDELYDMAIANGDYIGALRIDDSKAKLLRLLDDGRAFDEMLKTIEKEIEIETKPYQMSLELIEGLTYQAATKIAEHMSGDNVSGSLPAAIAMVRAGQNANLQLEMFDRLEELRSGVSTNAD